MPDPNEDFVAEPEVPVDMPSGGEPEVDDAPAQSLSVQDSEEYKRLAAEKADLERAVREYDTRLRQAQAPPPKKQEPTEDPLDSLEDQIAEASGVFQTYDTWCRLNPKDPDIVEGRKVRDEAKSSLLKLQKQYRQAATKAHVDAVKGLASRQSEQQQLSDHWAREIENDPLCRELTEEAKMDLHNKIMNGADPIKARTFVRKMLRLDPDKVTQGFKPSLQSLPGGRNQYIPTEGAGGGGQEAETSAEDFNKALAARRKKQAQNFGYGGN